MSIEFTTAFTETPVVEFSYSVDDLQPLFDDYLSWSPNLELNGLGYDELVKRLTKPSSYVSGTAWRTLIKDMNDAKLPLINHMLDIDTRYRWPNISLQMSKQISIYLSLVADLPGYSMSPHLDNRSVYGAGYLNIFDNDPVTVISTRQRSLFGIKSSDEYHAPGTKGTGVLWLNTENSWHWVKNVTQDRRIIMISLQIVPWE
jgi:hypothetical protein